MTMAKNENDDEPPSKSFQNAEKLSGPREHHVKKKQGRTGKTRTKSKSAGLGVREMEVRTWHIWKKSKGTGDKWFCVMAKPGGRLSHPPPPPCETQ